MNPKLILWKYHLQPYWLRKKRHIDDTNNQDQEDRTSIQIPEILNEKYKTIAKHYAHKIDISDEVDQSLKNTNYQNK